MRQLGAKRGMKPPLGTNISFPAIKPPGFDEIGSERGTAAAVTRCTDGVAGALQKVTVATRSKLWSTQQRSARCTHLTVTLQRYVPFAREC